MLAEIESARADAGPIGGITRMRPQSACQRTGRRAVCGLEGRMSMALFGVPAVKGVEFGDGFDCATLRGSQNNDPFVIENGKIKTLTNNAGGILGGITTGMPLIFKVAIKPTPSIGKPQQSVSLSRMENSELVIKGRHDPCIVPRAVPVIEAAAALALLDVML